MLNRVLICGPRAERAVACEAEQRLTVHRADDGKAPRILCLEPSGHGLRRPRLVVVERGRVDDRFVQDLEDRDCVHVVRTDSELHLVYRSGRIAGTLDPRSVGLRRWISTGGGRVAWGGGGRLVTSSSLRFKPIAGFAASNASTSFRMASHSRSAFLMSASQSQPNQSIGKLSLKRHSLASPFVKRRIGMVASEGLSSVPTSGMLRIG